MFYKRCGAPEGLLCGANNNQFAQPFIKAFVALFSFISSVECPWCPQSSRLKSIWFTGCSARADPCWAALVAGMLLKRETDLSFTSACPQQGPVVCLYLLSPSGSGLLPACSFKQCVVMWIFQSCCVSLHAFTSCSELAGLTWLNLMKATSFLHWSIIKFLKLLLNYC